MKHDKKNFPRLFALGVRTIAEPLLHVDSDKLRAALERAGVTAPEFANTFVNLGGKVTHLGGSPPDIERALAEMGIPEKL